MTADQGDGLEGDRVEFGLAWALLIVFTSILLVGAVWMLLNIFVGVLEAEAVGDLPAYSAEETEYSINWLMSIWMFLPVVALLCILAWGVLRSVFETGGAGGGI